jgi:hypothetical protein
MYEHTATPAVLSKLLPVHRFSPKAVGRLATAPPCTVILIAEGYSDFSTCCAAWRTEICPSSGRLICRQLCRAVDRMLSPHTVLTFGHFWMTNPYFFTAAVAFTAVHADWK